MSDTLKNLFATPAAALDPLPHMRPSVRISPFSPAEWENLTNAAPAKPVNPDCRPEFWLDGARDIQFYANGRTAILACLKHLALRPEDEVLIITTTQGPYISSCVTQTIEGVCQWSRELTDNTRLALVIHEFGFPCRPDEIMMLKEKGIPILEDCAYAAGTRIENGPVGTFGDFAVYSLPKYYPVPFGGILASQAPLNQTAQNLAASEDEEKNLKLLLANARNSCPEWNRRRKANWDFFAEFLISCGFEPYFVLKNGVVPGVFVMKVPDNFEGEAVKKRLNGAGVESTQYYNQGGFYFPVHQFLTLFEKEYILCHYLGRERTARLNAE